MAAIDEVLEAVEHTLGVSCQHTEPSYSLNAHNDGDFYRPHQDTSAEFAPRRLLTFVYYLHRTPRPFDGRELRVFDAATATAHRDSREMAGTHLAGLGARARPVVRGFGAAQPAVDGETAVRVVLARAADRPYLSSSAVAGTARRRGGQAGLVRNSSSGCASSGPPH
ncbi:2OG-Fe(II) oxygenase [Streptomyces mirabilis]|uniref:2OG-Fe(II) oxygenase n=1 Tax=Streptomyces mirabilis TaxID=68239 RepID=UPI0036B5CA8F